MMGANCDFDKIALLDQIANSPHIKADNVSHTFRAPFPVPRAKTQGTTSHYRLVPMAIFGQRHIVVLSSTSVTP